MTIGGKPAYLFSSRNQKTVSRHFRWMKEYGLDGVLVQRFVGEIRGKHADGDVVLKNIMAAARESGRTFAIEYDISGGNPETFAQTLKDDWVYLVDELKVTSHPNYQRHNGKPVVSVWGMGLSDGNAPSARRPAGRERPDRVVQSKAARANTSVTYMGGTPARWGTLTTRFAHRPGMGRRLRSDGCRSALECRPLRHTRSRRPLEGRRAGARRQSWPPRIIRSTCPWSSPASPGTTCKRNAQGKSDPAAARRVSLAPGVQRQNGRRQGSEDCDVRRGG